MEQWHFWFVGRRALVDRLAHQYLDRDVHRVFDLGCGTGLTVELLRRRGYTVVGMDQRPEGLRSARGRTPEGLLVQGEAIRLPFASSCLDAVFILDVLEHVDDRAALVEVRRVLRPFGQVILTVPAFPQLWSYRDEAAGHRRRYTRAQLARLLEESGLLPETVRYYQFLLFPLVVLFRLAGRKSALPRDLEERPLPALNALMSLINRFEIALGAVVRWPWGSSLSAVCRKV